MAWKLGKNSIEIYESGLALDWLKIIDTALIYCPVDFTLTSGLRSLFEQSELYKIGRRKNRAGKWVKTGAGVVTY
ncbi:unnamed protein product, partial [marine sediment metagenome]